MLLPEQRWIYRTGFCVVSLTGVSYRLSLVKTGFSVRIQLELFFSTGYRSCRFSRSTFPPLRTFFLFSTNDKCTFTPIRFSIVANDFVFCSVAFQKNCIRVKINFKHQSYRFTVWLASASEQCYVQTTDQLSTLAFQSYKLTSSSSICPSNKAFFTLGRNFKLLQLIEHGTRYMISRVDHNERRR